ncbi:MAG TPA: tRNA lysidine(34) synthetase TilS, partial [Salinimicrobium sp.]|nr:tRNA lysidine(34) synthetase TilS [Salinimicrobium sp.]
TKYLRNSIRHEIVPLLQKLNPQVLEGFQKTQTHLQQNANLVDDYISVIFSRVAGKTEFGYSFNIKKLKNIPHTRAVIFQLFKSFGFTEWDDVFHLLNAQPGKMVVSKTHRLVKDREELLLTTLPSEEKTIYKIPKGEEVVILPIGTFHLEETHHISEENSYCIFVDKTKLKFPLSLRTRKKGDIFYPSGMDGKKKLSKFFKDKKLSLPEKENCWLLCCGEEVVWVVGHRQDRRFETDGHSTKILKITYRL